MVLTHESRVVTICTTRFIVNTLYILLEENINASFKDNKKPILVLQRANCLLSGDMYTVSIGSCADHVHRPPNCPLVRR